MAGLSWSDSFSVGVNEIDAQHKKLIDLLNKLSDAMRAGKGNDVLGGILNELISYTQTHFKTEERYFKQYNYPDTQAHVAEHNAFVKKVSEFKEGFDAGKLAVSIDVMKFLGDWLVKHIKGSDQKYAPYLSK